MKGSQIGSAASHFGRQAGSPNNGPDTGSYSFKPPTTRNTDQSHLTDAINCQTIPKLVQDIQARLEE